MSGPLFAVYKPPSAGLPYLAVMFLPDGEVVAMSYPDAAGAEAHNAQAAQGLAEAMALAKG